MFEDGLPRPSSPSSPIEAPKLPTLSQFQQPQIDILQDALACREAECRDLRQKLESRDLNLKQCKEKLESYARSIEAQKLELTARSESIIRLQEQLSLRPPADVAMAQVRLKATQQLLQEAKRELALSDSRLEAVAAECAFRGELIRRLAGDSPLLAIIDPRL